MGAGFASAVSTFCGWTYFIAWSASFYPQIVLNHKRASVRGLSLDFVALNVTGFCAYALYTLCLYALPAASADFLSKRGVPPQVPLNDVVFGVHGALTCAVVAAQCALYPRSAHSLRPLVAASCLAFWAAIAAGALLASRGRVSWLGYLDMCGGIKVACSFVKYVPQVASNFRRKSTTGFAATGMALDLVGGVFSLAQQGVTAGVMRSAAPFSSNPAKTFLAAETLLFDAIFLYQHFVLYPRGAEEYGRVAGEEGFAGKEMEVLDGEGRGEGTTAELGKMGGLLDEEEQNAGMTSSATGSNGDLRRTRQAE